MGMPLKQASYLHLEGPGRTLCTSNDSLATVGIAKLLLLAVKRSQMSTASRALPCPSLDVGLPGGKTLPRSLTLNDPNGHHSGCT